MHLLILGGTGLTGTQLTLAALERGHSVVAVHRGRSDTLPELDGDQLVDLEHDRVNGHADLLAYGPFDAIIDVSARLPAWVADAVRVLDGAGQPWWVQLSSVSAYADLARSGAREEDAVAQFDDPVLELRACTDPTAELPGDSYGAIKAASERLLLEASARQMRSTVLRPVLITGEHDSTWRVPWWVQRIAAGAVTVAPPADDPIQVIDARDVARLALDAVEHRIPGVYNAAPAPGSQTVGALIEACTEAVRAAGLEPARVVHAPRELLAAQDIAPWQELPAWIAPGTGYDGMVTARTELVEELFAFEARPLTDTMRHVLAWVQRLGPEQVAAGIARAGTGLAPEREQALLAPLAV